jgi:hypothetical protein
MIASRSSLVGSDSRIVLPSRRITSRTVILPAYRGPDGGRLADLADQVAENYGCGLSRTPALLILWGRCVASRRVLA